MDEQELKELEEQLDDIFRNPIDLILDHPAKLGEGKYSLEIALTTDTKILPKEELEVNLNSFGLAKCGLEIYTTNNTNYSIHLITVWNESSRGDIFWIICKLLYDIDKHLFNIKTLNGRPRDAFERLLKNINLELFLQGPSKIPPTV